MSMSEPSEPKTAEPTSQQEPEVSFMLAVAYKEGGGFVFRSFINESSPRTYKDLVDQVFVMMRRQFDEGDADERRADRKP